MLFNSLNFALFFPIVLIAYYLLPLKIRQYWLLVASYYFYMCWNVKYILLLFSITFVTYFCGRFLSTSRHKKAILITSTIINLGCLFYFKYASWCYSAFLKLLSIANLTPTTRTFDILLPVGISFFTFQAIGYTIDVYRGDIYAEKNFFRYALFVSFFPQLVAGPIERSKNLLKQLAHPQRFQFERFREGFLIMLWGYFLKIVLADRISIFVDTVYGNASTYYGWYIVIATMFFAIQIYCDFAGYSIIALGAAKIIGINLSENFDAPYISTSVASFWRKWHISLTSWFRDYVYIPLGGNRKGPRRKFINLMIVFLLSGLWHGASLAFIIWGFLNGLYQIMGNLLKPIRDRFVNLFRLNRDSLAHKMLQAAITFTLVDFSWVFFRAGSVSKAIHILREIPTKSLIPIKAPWILYDGSLYQCGLDRSNFLFMLLCIVVLFFADFCKHRKIVIHDIILKQDAWFRCLFTAFAVVFILIFGIWGSSYDATGFIYFKF